MKKVPACMRTPTLCPAVMCHFTDCSVLSLWERISCWKKVTLCGKKHCEPESYYVVIKAPSVACFRIIVWNVWTYKSFSYTKEYHIWKSLADGGLCCGTVGYEIV